MNQINVFEIIEHIPKGTNIVSWAWLFKYKHDKNGNITKRKARLVARGFSQRFGIDYFYTFSPTLKLDSLHIIVVIAFQRNFKILQIDINASYLNAKLTEDIYMKPPEGYNNGSNQGYWKLKRALYSLIQAGRQWNDDLNNSLLEMNSRRLVSEPCIYIKENETKEMICIITVYVYDILIIGKDKDVLFVKDQIQEKYKIKDIGEVDFVIKIKFEKVNDGYILHQREYLKELLRKYNLIRCNPTRNTKPLEDTNLRSNSFKETTYWSTIGNLLYLFYFYFLFFLFLFLILFFIFFSFIYFYV